MKKNKNTIIGILSITVCVILMVTLIVSVSIDSKNNENYGVHKEDTGDVIDNTSTITSSKQETVYVIASADGSAKKIIVSDWIKNPDASNRLEDNTTLTNVENVKGDGSYIMGDDNSIIWNANGDDIYYSGDCSNELPVKLLVTYTLDGNVTSIDNLAGKSGHLVIRYDYINNQYQTVQINGQEEKIYVPFLMLTGLMLDNDIFRNVEITNGKLINDGDRTFAVGFTLPGLRKNLGVDENKVKLPEFVEIEADVNNFEMTNTVTIASNDIFNKINSNDLNNLCDKLINANTSVEDLVNGVNDLYTGVLLLVQKSNELVNGVNQLANGATELKNGSEEALNGATDLVSNNKALVAGAKKTFLVLLSTADAELNKAGFEDLDPLTIENYSLVLGQLISSLEEENVRQLATSKALQTVTEAVNENRELIKNQVYAVVRDQVKQQVTLVYQANVKNEVVASLDMTVEQYDQGVIDGTISEDVQGQVNQQITTQMESDPIKNAIEEQVNTEMEKDYTKQLIESETDKAVQNTIDEKMASSEVQSQIETAVDTAKAGSKKLTELKNSLVEYNTFYDGVNNYTNGVSNLKDGLEALDEGINDLYDGIILLKNNLPALTNGEGQLKEGLEQLVDAINDMYTNQYEVFIDACGGDLPTFITRLKATIDVSKAYTNYSGLNSETDGSVKFIYRTDEIKLK